jgi:hypothetical protein
MDINRLARKALDGDEDAFMEFILWTTDEQQLTLLERVPNQDREDVRFEIIEKTLEGYRAHLRGLRHCKDIEDLNALVGTDAVDVVRSYKRDWRRGRHVGGDPNLEDRADRHQPGNCDGSMLWSAMEAALHKLIQRASSSLDKKSARDCRGAIAIGLVLLATRHRAVEEGDDISIQDKDGKTHRLVIGREHRFNISAVVALMNEQVRRPLWDRLKLGAWPQLGRTRVKTALDLLQSELTGLIQENNEDENDKKTLKRDLCAGQ